MNYLIIRWSVKVKSNVQDVMNNFTKINNMIVLM